MEQYYYDQNEYDSAKHWMRFYNLPNNKYDVVFAEYAGTIMLLWNRELQAYAFCFKNIFSIFNVTHYGNFVQRVLFNDADIFTITHLSTAPNRKVFAYAVKHYDNSHVEHQFAFGVKRFGNFAIKLKTLRNNRLVKEPETIINRINSDILDVL